MLDKCDKRGDSSSDEGSVNESSDQVEPQISQTMTSVSPALQQIPMMEEVYIAKSLLRAGKGHNSD